MLGYNDFINVIHLTQWSGKSAGQTLNSDDYDAEPLSARRCAGLRAGVFSIKRLASLRYSSGQTVLHVRRG